MAVELHGHDRRRAASLFAALPGTRACVTAGLSGEFGRMWVDDAQIPTVAHLHLDFHFLVGDHSSPVADEMVRGLPKRLGIISFADWEPLLRSVHGHALKSYTRTAFGGARWDRGTLSRFVRGLPEGYRLLRVTAAEVESFAAFDRSLVKNFRNLDHFLAEGVGFAIQHQGEIVAGCASYTQAEGQVEIEIDTGKQHRRRGLALTTGSALILHCLEHGLVPCWDAANEASARLATKLGFTGAVQYTAWFMRESKP